MTTPFSTPDAAKAFAMDVKGVAPKDVIAQALILQCSTKAANVEGDAPAVRIPFVSLEDQPDWVAEGDEIPEADPDDTEKVIYTSKIAELIAVSREQYGQEDVASLLDDAVRDALIRKANRRFLAQAAPTPPATNPPAGLINQGISSVLTPIEDNLDPVVDAIAAIETAGGTATHILAHPVAWAELCKLKLATDSNASLIGAGTDGAQRQLLNVPVLVDRDVPLASMLVLDRKAVLSAYGQVQIARSDHFYFNRDTIGIRATFRFGATVSDTNRVVMVTVFDAS